MANPDTPEILEQIVLSRHAQVGVDDPFNTRLIDDVLRLGPAAEYMLAHTLLGSPIAWQHGPLVCRSKDLNDLKTPLGDFTVSLNLTARVSEQVRKQLGAFFGYDVVDVGLQLIGSSEEAKPSHHALGRFTLLQALSVGENKHARFGYEPPREADELQGGEAKYRAYAKKCLIEAVRLARLDDTFFSFTNVFLDGGLRPLPARTASI
ncbi:MAG TPA: hypothetical protein VHB51_04105 [Candidatus Saccharimonadales bacterium]|nr:hypothetical protein [Candidatus Saccharimonadales bacterium]